MLRKILGLVLALLVFSLIAVDAHADQLALGSMFSDHAVIQRNKPITIWGKADANATVQVSLKDVSKTATADDQGEWAVTLPAMKAGGPYELTIKSGDQTITLQDILLGDIWICSGQSNMQWPVARANNADKEIAAADYPKIRLFTVGRNPSVQPVKEVSGQWKQASPETVPDFSAVGFFFGRELYQQLNIPIGLIDNAWGGMPAEAYTTRSTLESDPDLKPIVDRFIERIENLPQAMAAHEKQLAETRKRIAEHGAKELSTGNLQNIPNMGLEKGYNQPDFDDSNWPTMPLPSTWERQGLYLDGVVWFRKQLDIPSDWAGKTLTLKFGAIDDSGIIYFNGQKIDKTNQNPNLQYTLPADIVKAGKAVVALRVIDNRRFGGIRRGPLEIQPADGSSDPINLAGPWRYRITAPLVRKQKPAGKESPRNPAALWNGMTEPISPYAITGVIWYQGESNASRGYQYRPLFRSMINDWRDLFGDDITFLFVQLANFRDPQTDPGEGSTWAELREAQAMALQLPKTGMATAIDIGEAYNIHPRDKQTVGQRLANNALAIQYGRDVTHQGPTFESMEVEGDQIRLTFKHTDGGLKVKGDELTGFAIAGSDQQWYWADAEIDGNTVVVSSEQVQQPVAVRYGWANNPPVSLYNGEGWPAPPFRTDDWPGVTIDNR